MLSETLDFRDTLTFYGPDVNAHDPLIGCFRKKKPHSEVSDILTKRLCKTNVFSPLDLLCHKRVSHVQIFPILLWSLGTEGEGMMSWSGGGRGEKG